MKTIILGLACLAVAFAVKLEIKSETGSVEFGVKGDVALRRMYGALEVEATFLQVDALKIGEMTLEEFIEASVRKRIKPQIKMCDPGWGGPFCDQPQCYGPTCTPHKICNAGEWTFARGTTSTDTVCNPCPAGTTRPKAPVNTALESAAQCSKCVGKNQFSDETGLKSCKTCPAGHIGVDVEVVNCNKTTTECEVPGHKACDDSACERPTNVPENAMLVTAKCPENGKHTGKKADTCALACKTGFFSSGANVPYKCTPDSKTTTASYQGGSVKCAATQCTHSIAKMPAGVEVVLSNGHKHGSVASFKCTNAGFILTGAKSVKCNAPNADATWPTPKNPPMCMRTKCTGGGTKAPANGKVVLSSGNNHLSVATFLCNAGFKLMGTTAITCNAPKADAAWPTATETWLKATTCMRTQCTGSNAKPPANGKVVLSNGNKHDSVAKFSCNSGFKLSGAMSILCSAPDADAAWVTPKVTPTCKPHTICNAGQWTSVGGTSYKDNVCSPCPAGTARPTAPVNSALETVAKCSACVVKNQFSDQTGLKSCKTCPAGHFGVVVAGSAKAGGHKACDDDTCERPTALPKNAVVVTAKCPQNGKHIGKTADTCELACKTGFSLSANVPYKCAPDKKTTTASYQGGSVKCAATQCTGSGANAPSNGKVSKSNGNKHGSNAQFSCNVGYKMSGASSIKCNAPNGNAGWPGGPTCMRTKCTGSNANAPSNGKVSKNNGNKHLSVSTFSCNTGYSLGSTTTSITCNAPNADKAWPSKSTSCTATKCTGSKANAPSNGKVSKTNGNSHGSTAQFSCNSGYTRVGASSIKCNAPNGNAKWPGGRPTCKPTLCTAYNGKKVTFLGHHGKYVVAESNGQANCNRGAAGSWEHFTFICLGGSTIGLKSAHNKYLVAESNGACNANRGALGGWERWTLIDLGGGVVALKSYHNKYLVAESNGQLNANRGGLGSWEKFRMN